MALSNCSGSLIQLENAKDTDFALVLTNGHCNETGFVPPGQYISEKNSSRTFALLNSQANKIGYVHATQIIYATMTTTDITLYRLQETYADIKTKFSIRPLTLSSKHPAGNANIEVISGFWHRGYTCAIDTFVIQLQEGNWFFKDSVRYSQPGCETIPGTSGSPVLEAGTRTVIAINNTGNDSGQKCTEDNPCEEDASGAVIKYQKGLSYAQETYLIYSCLNPNGEFDLAVSGCALPH